MKIVDKDKPGKEHFRLRATVVLAAVTVILYLRKPDAFLNPQFWAEDGVIFFHQCHVFGLKSLLMPYAGYLHSIPRLFAYLTSFFPRNLAPAIYNYAALGLLLFACAYILTYRIELKYKTLLTVAVALVPYNSVCYMNLTNVQWILAPLLLMPILQTPPKRLLHYVMDFTMLVLVGLTGPFIVLILPLYVHRWFRDRSRYLLGVCLVSAVLASLQLLLLITTGKERGGFELDSPSWLSLIALRGSGDLLFGRVVAEQAPQLVLVLFALLLPAGILLLARGERHRFYAVSVLLYFAVVAFLATLVKHRATPDTLLVIGHADGYFYLPYLLIMWALVQCLGGTRLKGLIAAALLALLLLSTTRNFRAEPLVDFHWKEYCEELSTTRLTEIPINPPGWSMRLKLKSE